MRALDARLYLDVNRWAVRTGDLHGLGRACASWVPLALAAACLVAAWLRARRREDAPMAVASSLWALAAALVAAAVDRAVAGAIGRARPYESLRAVEVLVERVRSPDLPNVATAVVAAAAASLWLSDRPSALVASLAAVLTGAAQVYVGAAYPGDAAAGLALGAVLAVALRPVGILVLRWLTVKIERSPLHLIVAAHRA